MVTKNIKIMKGQFIFLFLMKKKTTMKEKPLKNSGLWLVSIL